jgi:hypothetical protein
VEEVAAKAATLLEGDRATPAVPGSTVTVVLDPDSFAKALAVALAAILEERRPPAAPTSVVAPPTAAWVPQPVVAPPWWAYHTGAAGALAPAPPPKRSFWADTWHADVILWVVALGIAVLVLLAWVS